VLSAVLPDDRAEKEDYGAQAPVRFQRASDCPRSFFDNCNFHDSFAERAPYYIFG
jgi:hypothetical protein